jgi:putative NIF3 family GTP cyclohydrolase 1 type 2
MNPISRREFVTLAAVGAVAAPPAVYSRFVHPPAALTAQEIVDRIRQKIGVEWKTDTVDTFKAGDPATAVKGIVTTSIATIDVLKQVVKAGANLVITCEPTFYSKTDAAEPASGRRGGPPPPPDPVFTAKNEFIKNNGLVIWRFSDHWRQRNPDPLADGLTDALGWSKFRTPGDAARVTIPELTLAALASDLKKKLNARGGIRVVGNPQLRVKKIGLLPGATPIQSALKLLPDVDTVIAGEVREWESVEYARDKVSAGEKKSLILLGRIVSENPCMKVCAQWIKTIVPEVATTWIPVSDPYWRPV